MIERCGRIEGGAAVVDAEPAGVTVLELPWRQGTQRLKAVGNRKSSCRPAKKAPRPGRCRAGGGGDGIHPWPGGYDHQDGSRGSRRYNKN